MNPSGEKLVSKFACKFNLCLYTAGERLEQERDRFVRAWASHEASTRRRAFAGPLPKNWVHQSDPLTGKVFYLNLKNGELHREHPVLKPILPRRGCTS